MVDELRPLPPEKQRWTRAVALSMEGPRYRETESITLPLLALGGLLYALVALFG